MSEKKFIINDEGKKLAVILPINEYEQLLEALENLEDIKLYDSSKKGNLKFYDLNEALEITDKERNIQ